MKFFGPIPISAFACLFGALLLCSASVRAQDQPPTPPPASAPTAQPQPQSDSPQQQQPAPTDSAAPTDTAPVRRKRQPPRRHAAPAPTSFEISGIVKSGKTPLPGVTVTAANTLTGKKYSVATALDGSYKFSGLRADATSCASSSWRSRRKPRRSSSSPTRPPENSTPR